MQKWKHKQSSKERHYLLCNSYIACIEKTKVATVWSSISFAFELVFCVVVWVCLVAKEAFCFQQIGGFLVIS